MAITATRYHDFCAGHRVVGHESKCAHLHGHNYRVHFTIQAEELDAVGRVVDFSVIKSLLAEWLEENWDHKFLAWKKDPLMTDIAGLYYDEPMGHGKFALQEQLLGSIVWVPFNPTAENMGDHLIKVVGPQQLEGTGCTLVKVLIEETRKCSVEVTK